MYICMYVYVYVFSCEMIAVLDKSDSEYTVCLVKTCEFLLSIERQVCMSIYMYMYIYICMCIYIYVYVCLGKCVYIRFHTWGGYD